MKLKSGLRRMILSSDIVGDLLGTTMMDFLIPGIIAGVIGAYVLYKMGVSWGWI